MGFTSQQLISNCWKRISGCFCLDRLRLFPRSSQEMTFLPVVNLSEEMKFQLERLFSGLSCAYRPGLVRMREESWKIYDVSDGEAPFILLGWY